MSVYFAQVGPYIKVGFSQNPERRVKRLFSSTTRYSAPAGVLNQTPTLIRYIDGNLGTERLIHAALDDFRVGQEWFVDEPEVQQFIANVRTAKSYRKVARPAGPIVDERDAWSDMSAGDRKNLMAALGYADSA